MTVSKADHRTPARSQRPKATTVFAAAFLAGAAAAVGLNRTLDVHLAQRQPRVESEPIFVALRSLPLGAPVTVWDVALRDWPKAMLPAAAMRRWGAEPGGSVNLARRPKADFRLPDAGGASVSNALL
jgi:Flp pilus assembly protein CpaB